MVVYLDLKKIVEVKPKGSGNKKPLKPVKLSLPFKEQTGGFCLNCD